MLNSNGSPSAMLTSFWSNRSLVLALTKREIIGRYRGSYLGLLWSFFNPLFMLAIYSFVFGEIFKSRWSGGTGSKSEFTLILFSGLIVLNIFSECVARAPNLILSNVNYVKRVVFPLEILPWVIMGTALFHGAVSLFAWLIAYSLLVGLPHATAFILPLVLLPFILLIMGFSLMLASLGVFLRDMGQMIGLIITAMMFLAPIFFPITTLPEAYHTLIRFNPLTIPIEQVREVLIWGKLPDWKMLAIYGGLSLIIAWFGFFWFQKTRKGFADVL